MKTRKHLLFLSCAVAGILTMTSLSSCTDETDVNGTVGKDGLLSLEGYPTIFSSGKTANANEGGFSVNIKDASPKKISTDKNYEWWWTYGDKIYVNNGGSFIPSAQSNIPSGGATLNHWADFGFNQSLGGDSYEVRYVGNAATGNPNDGSNPNQVTICAEQTQDVEGSSVHIGKYGDCGIATANKVAGTSNPTEYSFELDHKASYLMFTPYVNVEGGVVDASENFIKTTHPYLYTKKTSSSDVGVFYDRTIPIKSITVTKLDDGTLCGTYPFTSAGLQVGSVTNGGKTIKLNCPKVDEGTKDSSIGDQADEGKILYMVVQPGEHKLKIDYEIDYPEIVCTSGTPTINWDTKMFSFTTAAHTFTANGFTKAKHCLEIPAYRETFTYYAWGASAHYFANYNDMKKVGDDYISHESRSYSFDAPLTSRSNEYVAESDKVSYSTCQSDKDETYATGLGLAHTDDYNKNCGYIINGKQLYHYYDDMREFFNTRIAIADPRDKAKGKDGTAKVLGSFGGYDYPAYHLPVYLPLWPVSSTMGKIKFYTKGAGSVGPSGGRYSFTVPTVEPPFLKNSTINTNKNIVCGTESDFERVVHKMTSVANPDHTTSNYFEISNLDKIEVGTILPVIHVNRGGGSGTGGQEDFTGMYRSITRMPNANEMTWYLKHGDIHYDNTTHWLISDKTIYGMNPLVRGGIWIKKKEYITGFKDNLSADGIDLRTTCPTNNNQYRNYVETYTGDMPSGAVKEVKVGVPANKEQYFFLPCLGYYHTSADATNPSNTSVDLKYFGERGYYWTRTPWPGTIPGDNEPPVIGGDEPPVSPVGKRRATASDGQDDYSLSGDRESYYLIFTPEYVALSWAMRENRKHGMVGNERPDWHRKMNPNGSKTAETYIADDMQNDWWFQ